VNKDNLERLSKISRSKCHNANIFSKELDFHSCVTFFIRDLNIYLRFLAMRCGNDDIMTCCISAVRFEKRAS